VVCYSVRLNRYDGYDFKYTYDPHDPGSISENDFENL
jgi:hypothetical protein